MLHLKVLPNITSDNIQNLLQSMPSHKPTGLDAIGARVLKVAAPSISSFLAHLINHCIDNSKFPFKWKSAKVTPIYIDHGSKKDMKNYQPTDYTSLFN